MKKWILRFFFFLGRRQKWQKTRIGDCYCTLLCRWKRAIEPSKRPNDFSPEKNRNWLVARRDPSFWNWNQRPKKADWLVSSFLCQTYGWRSRWKNSRENCNKSEESEAKKPKYRALFTYAGQHDDELAFNAGDVITLLSKDEEAWWKGELDGRVGVFPSNYVEEINWISRAL